ncbi:MAG TPA: hypothetical protein VNG93_06545 [Candidatus Dormibacteraeota bacterium]|nr:hypothetical protein [Candidatus Dormibacteraeota bacterium]
MNDSSAWLDRLPADLTEHGRVLRALIAAARADGRIRALQVQGSVGRGEADRHSDLDLGVLLEAEGWEAAAVLIQGMIAGLGPIVDSHIELLPSPHDPRMLRAWAQLDSGIQVDLLALPADGRLGSGPDGRTLHDPDRLVMRTDHPERLTAPVQVERWSFLSWHALADAAKAYERGRLVLAAELLNPSRQALVSCWGAAHGVDYAGYANVVAGGLGVSSPWLEGLELTYAHPEAAELRAALLQLAELQARTDELIAERMGVRPRPLGGWVRERLARLPAEPPSRGTRPAPGSRRGRRAGAPRRPPAPPA